MRKITLHGFIICSISTLVFFLGIVYIFTHTYWYDADRIRKMRNNPRWRVFDFNTRQAAENEIYNVKEIPVISNTREVTSRKIRFDFSPPIKTDIWKVLQTKSGRILSESKYPEIQFPDTTYHETYTLVPDGIDLLKEITLFIQFYPTEVCYENGLSWPDDILKITSTIPFNTVEPYSIDEWISLPDDDPEVIEARQIMGDLIDMNASTVTRVEQVLRFIMEKLNNSNGWPTDATQAASPLETYKILSSGQGTGWCEERQVVLYLFANAAGINTRVVDIAGRFGPLQLPLHYFCEIWIPEEASWCYVDPSTGIAGVINSEGRYMNILEVKRLRDLDALNPCNVRIFDKESGEIISRAWVESNLDVFPYQGDIVIAYKFGYGNCKSFPKLRNFIKYTTLVISPFPVPKLYRVKYACLIGFPVVLVFAVFFGIGLIISRKHLCEA